MKGPKLNRKGRRFARKMRRKFPQYMELIERGIYNRKLERTELKDD